MKVSFRFVRPARSAGARSVVTSTLPRAADASGVVPVAATHRVARERLHVAAQVRLADRREARRCAGRRRLTGVRRGVLRRRLERRDQGDSHRSHHDGVCN